jgi:large conductance mechanosensitive channel
MQRILAEFKDFMNRGDFVTIAVGLIIALQTVAVVNAIIEGIINPIIAAILGKNNLSDFGFDIGDARISIGLVISALITFLVVLAILFVALKAWNALKRRSPEDDIETELSVLKQIRDGLNRPN